MSDEKKDFEEFGLVERKITIATEEMKSPTDARLGEIFHHEIQSRELYSSGQPRVVARTVTPAGVEISTIRMKYFNQFETSIFGGKHDGWCERTLNKSSAELAHNHAVRKVYVKIK